MVFASSHYFFVDQKSCVHNMAYGCCGRDSFPESDSGGGMKGVSLQTQLT